MIALQPVCLAALRNTNADTIAEHHPAGTTPI